MSDIDWTIVLSAAIASVPATIAAWGSYRVSLRTDHKVDRVQEKTESMEADVKTAHRIGVADGFRRAASGRVPAIRDDETPLPGRDTPPTGIPAASVPAPIGPEPTERRRRSIPATLPIPGTTTPPKK